MIQSTSLQAYKDIKPTLGDRQRRVYEEILKHKGVTNSEIAVALRVPINRITGRTRELVKMGWVEKGEKRECRITGKTVITWKAVLPTIKEEQLSFLEF